MSDRETNNRASALPVPQARWLLVALAALLFFAPLLFWSGLYESLNLPKRTLIQISALLLCGLASWQRLPVKRRLPQPLAFLVGCFLLWALASLGWSVNPWLGWSTWMQWTACALIGWLVLKLQPDNKDTRLLLWAMTASGAVAAVIGLAQAWNWLTWIPQAIPPAATFANRNMAAQFMVLTIPLAVTLLHLARSRREFLGATLALTLGCAFLLHTFTKSCWLGAGTGLAVALVFGLRTGWWPSFASAPLRSMMFAAVVALLAINVTAHGWRWRLPEIGSYLTGLADEPDQTATEAERLQAKSARSVSTRATFWQNTLVMIKEHPVLGVGLNNWRIHYPGSTIHGIADPTLKLNRAPQRTHNDLLQIWAELGSIGLLLALGIIGMFLWSISQALKQASSREEKWVLLGSVIALTAIAVDSLASFPLDREIPPLYAAVLGALILRRTLVADKETATDRQPLLASAALAGCLALTVVHYRMWQADSLYKAELDALKQKDWRDVALLGLRVRTWDATRYDAMRYEGYALAQLGQLDEAYERLTRAHELVPDDPQVLYYLGDTALHMQKYPQAIEWFSRAAAILPGEALFPHQLGLLYLAQRDANGAIRELLKAKELSPDDATVYFNLGLAYELQGKPEEAKASYQKAMELKIN